MRHGTLRIVIAALAALAAAGSTASATPMRAAIVTGADVVAPLQLVQLFGQRSDDSDVVARLSRLENQIRQLTGMVEELQHRNSQLEQQLKRAQQDNEFRFQELNPSGRPPAARGQSGSAPPPGPPPLTSRGPGDAPSARAPSAPPEQSPPAASGRRGDVFDPTSAPNAPGAPRVLGSPGTPLDLGSLANAQDSPPLPGSGSGFPPAASGSSPPPGVGAPVGQQAVLAPSGSARDEYDLAFGAIQRRDYELAVDGFRGFLANHGGSREPDAQRLVPEAHYWMGEAQFQLKRYSDSAESFLKISTDFPNAVKAPDALLRLGQSLAALGERETACASLGHVLTKYPKASATVKRAVEQEQKRVRC